MQVVESQTGKLVARARWLGLFTGIIMVATVGLRASPGELDPTFHPPATVLKGVDRVLALPEGKSLWLGQFMLGTNAAQLARLREDGSIDEEFLPVIIEGSVSHLALQSNGSILLGGELQSVNGEEAGPLVRLTASGAFDLGFRDRVHLRPLGGVGGAMLTGLEVDSRDGIFLSGHFVHAEGTAASQLIRTHPDGRLDAEYPLWKQNLTMPHLIKSPHPDQTWAVNLRQLGDDSLIRLLPGGEVAQPLLLELGQARAAIHSLQGRNQTYLFADGRPLHSHLPGPVFVGVDGHGHGRVIGIRSTSSDVSMNQADLRVAAIDPVGRMYLGGRFSGAGHPGHDEPLRSFPDGSLDERFHTGLRGSIKTLAVDSRGRLLVGGDLSVDESGHIVHAARLLAEDTAGPSFFGLLSTNETVVERAGNVELTVLREGAAGLPGSVWLTTVPGSASGADYEPRNELLRFAPGERFKRVHVSVHDNDHRDGNRDFRVSLAPVSGGGVGERAWGAVTVLDDEDAIGFARASLRVPERAGNLELSLERANANLMTRVRYSVDNPADQPLVDLDQGEVYFAPGALKTAIHLLLVDNDTTEANRRFKVRIETSTPAVVDGISEMTVTVADDDAPGFPGFGFVGHGTNSVNVILRDSRDRLLVGGSFLTANGGGNQNLVRLLPSGEMDPAFTVKDGGFPVVQTLVEDSLGRYLIGTRGESPNLQRLHPDGSRDPALSTTDIMDLRMILKLAVLPDRRIAVAGAVGSGPPHPVRVLSENGTRDTAASGSMTDHFLETGDGGGIADLATWLNGNLYASCMDGAGAGASLFRLANAGVADPSFQVHFDGLRPKPVNAVADGGDNRVVIAGRFRGIEGQSRGNIARIFERTGALDRSFANGPGANNWVREVRRLPGGNYLIFGFFTEYDGQPRNGIARLLANGRLDESFDPGSGPDAPINTVWIEADGTLLVGGRFNRWNDELRVGVAHLDQNGALIRTAPVFLSMAGNGGNGLSFHLEVEPDAEVRLLRSGDLRNWRAISTNRTARRVLPVQVEATAGNREFFQAERLDP